MSKRPCRVPVPQGRGIGPAARVRLRGNYAIMLPARVKVGPQGPLEGTCLYGRTTDVGA